MNQESASTSRPKPPGGVLGLRSRMLIAFCVPMAATLLLVGLVNTFGIPFTGYGGTYNLERDQVLRSLSLVADLKKERFELWLTERKDDVRKVCRDDSFVTAIGRLRELTSRERRAGKRGDELSSGLQKQTTYRNALHELRLALSSYPVFAKIRVADANTGLVLVSTEETDRGADVSDRRFFITALKEGYEESVVVEKDPLNDKPYLIMSRVLSTISTENGGEAVPTAVVSMYMDTEEFLKPMLYTGEGLGETGDIVLINQDGLILMSLKFPLKDGTRANVLEYRNKSKPAILASQGKEGIVAAEDYRGVPVLAAYRNLRVTPDRGWGMIVKRDQEEVFGPLWRQIVRSSGVALLGFVAAVLLGILTSNRISRPIRRLCSTVQEVEAGNLSARSPISGPPEVGILAGAFNSMVARVQNWHQDLEEQVKVRTARLNELNTELTREVARRTRAEEFLKKTNRRLLTLSDCNQAVIRAVEESSLLHEICRIVVEVGGYPTAWVGFAQNDESRTVRPVGRWGFEERDVDKLNVSWADDGKGRGPTGTAIRTGKICILRNALSDPVTAAWREELTRYEIGSLVSFPLLVEGQVIGAMTIAAKESDAFDEEEVKLLTELAGDLAYGIEMLRTRAERQEARASAVLANQEWERTFNAISDLIMVLDNQHKILRANRAMADALGMTEQEVIGKSCFELVHGEKEPPAFCPHARLLTDGEEYSTEVVEPRLGGIYDFRVSPLVDQNGQVIGSVHITRDITARKQMEEALSQSESMLRGVLQAAPIGIGVVSDRIFKWTNEFVSKMTGYSQEELLGRSARILYETDQEFEHVGAIKYAQIRATGSGTIETRWKRKDGNIIDIILSSTAIEPQDLSAGVVFTALDLTVRKQAEQALRGSEERYRAVFDNAGIGIDLVDRDGRIAQANPALLNMLGYTEEDFHHLTLMDITHPDDREISKQALEPIMRGEVPSYRLEKRYIKKDGSALWADLSVSAMRDAEGKYSAVGVIADITERKESQVKVKQSEERLRLIIDSSPIGIIIVQDSNYAYVNPRFAEIFGYDTAEEIQGLPLETIYGSESRRLILEKATTSGVGTRTISHYEAVGVSKSGKPIDAAAWVTDIDYFGKDAILAFVMDMTESKSLRSQLLQTQKMEAVGTLAGGIAHDFNNLLQVVLGYSELILMGEGLDTRLKDDLNRINQAARNGADLVHRLLTFSRKTEIKPRPLNLNHQIDQVRELLYRTVPRMIEIELVLDSNLAAINADPTQVEQILMNLAVNARDAMPDGGKLVIETENVVLDEDYCKTHLETAPGHYVLLTVSDSGQGMDRETLEHIFEPFYTTKRPGEGTGLGLAMVYGIVKQHQGYVTCYSEPDRGTTFKIYFPALVSGSQSEEALVKPVPRGGSETILLVDDEKLIRDLGGRILTRAGYRVLTAVNGKDALEVYRAGRQDISLVILDLIMPEMGGKQCLEEVLKIDPQARVLIASGYSVTGSSNEALAVGAKGFVNKPYDMRELLATVREVLDEE